MLLGELLPFNYRTRQLGEWVDVDLESSIGDDVVVLFGLPGAFTPTCSNHQLPDYDLLFSEFVSAGVGKIFCTSVNDPFVMNAWFEGQQVSNVIPLPDGNGLLAAQLGMLVDKGNLNFGLRSWRYAVVYCGKTKTVLQEFVEEGFSDNADTDPYEKSDPKTVLTWCKENLPG
jgi:thioredoxin-dependent peroxiredoxin